VKVYDNGLSLNTKILSGVNKLADAVSATLGPKGKNVVIHVKGRNPMITKDGVTVAQAVELQDPFENVGAQVLKQVSAVTAQEAGDGTTTATVLARSIMCEAQKYIIAGASPTDLKRGMDFAVEYIVKNIEEKSRPIKNLENIEHIATISANGDKKIGKLIATAVDKVGKDGAITIEAGKSVDTSLDIVEGFQMNSGYLSPQFITDEARAAMRFEDLRLLVTDHNIDNLDDLFPVLEIMAREKKPFVIIAENVEGQALAALILNAVRGNMKIGVVKAPKYGEERRNIMKDLALATGATFISRESGRPLRDIKLKDLGSAKTLESVKLHTTIVGGGGNYDDIEKHIEKLKLEITQTEDLAECERIQDRVTRLASGIAIIRVGGTTEVDMTERKHRIEDALEAVKSAQLEGILPGGGTALLKLSRGLENKVSVENQDERFGVKIIERACEEPIRKLSENCGDKPDVVIETILNKCSDDIWVGRNFATGEYVNLDASGIIDPAKVTRCALQNAVSAASTLLTTSHAIIDV
jgi:chaperonin GroEL